MSRLSIVIPCALLSTACFNPDPGAVSASGSSGGSGSGDDTSMTTMVSVSGTGQMSAEGSSGTPPLDTTVGSADSTTSVGTSGTTESVGTTEAVEDSGTTGEPLPCVPVGPAELGYIWIANSSQSTISRIATDSMVEQGRYLTRPDMNGDPSRTSVSLSGDVAVANRSGGLTKFYGDVADCIDLDGSGAIETSTGAADIRPWNQEECRAWHTPMVYTSQRPVAWAAGVLDEINCEYVDEVVWTAGVVNDATVEVLRVDGDTGVVQDVVVIPEIVPNFYGLYGGAVDAEGNFWASMLGQASLVRVDGATLDYQIWPMATTGYGMTVGASGYVFTCSNSVGRFDPVTETWTVSAPVGGSGGCAEDGMGRLWLASNPLVAIDVNTLTVVETINLPQYVHGVSVDFDDRIWGVTIFAPEAYRVDPVAGTFDTFSGLTQPYTYSDMTGFALTAVTP
ncbi:MAG: hypothetical protein KDK70_04915 [Myxococcales bacterium]|nr:hypothetical protein [Myxococcales bacterium]